MKVDKDLIKTRISQLKHQLLLSHDSHLLMNCVWAGALILVSALLFYFQDFERYKYSIFWTYVVIVVCVFIALGYVVYAYYHDRKLKKLIDKNYRLLVEE